MNTLNKVNLLLLFVLILISCGGTNQNSKLGAKLLPVGILLNEAAEWLEEDVEVEGLCTHICAHGGTKIFLMGEDDSEIIRIEAGKLGRFTNDCLNRMIKVRGELKEDRIDESYLQRWEKELKVQSDNHVKGEGCETEKKTRGEDLDQETLDRIATFRERILQEKEQTGKAYLSFYHVEAKEYEIQ